MTHRLQRVWQALSASLWFVPTLMILGAMLLAVTMIEVSDHVDREALTAYPRIFGASAQSSRDMLSTIASAMMTVAGVTFSITVLAVTQASSQYTPRILRNFMRDRPSQLTLGTLTGVFVYCLIVIRTIRGEEDIRFIPALAVMTAFVLAIVGIGVLIFFIHHVSSSLQASAILARVATDTVTAVERLFPDGVGEEAHQSDGEAQALAHTVWFVVPATRTGYVRGLDTDGLLRFAVEHDIIVRMEAGIGDHVVRGLPLASVAAAPLPNRELAGFAALYDIADFRTVEQDAEFGFRQMVDMAVKALSPGVNDTTTAITCIDSLGAALVALADRRIAERYRMHDGALRVIARGSTFASLVRTAVDEIRQNADGNVSVLERLLRMLTVVAGATPDVERRAVLRRHGERILAVSARSVPDTENRGAVREAFDRLQRVVDGQAAWMPRHASAPG